MEHEIGGLKMNKIIRGVRDLPDNAVYDEIDSPVGELTIITSPAGLHAILWDNNRKNQQNEKIFKRLPQVKNEKTLTATKKQLKEYFQGQRKVFDLPLVIHGTDFQMQAWRQLLKIPYGKTISYGTQAAKIGDKNKARAVGMANGLNPISIIIPCHRVIGSQGHLTGFGGGIDKKAYLLDLEQRFLHNGK